MLLAKQQRMQLSDLTEPFADTLRRHQQDSFLLTIEGEKGLGGSNDDASECLQTSRAEPFDRALRVRFRSHADLAMRLTRTMAAAA